MNLNNERWNIGMWYRIEEAKNVVSWVINRNRQSLYCDEVEKKNFMYANTKLTFYFFKKFDTNVIRVRKKLYNNIKIWKNA